MSAESESDQGGADPNPGEQVRALLRASDRAVLSTAQRDRDGWPYGSLVLTASDCDASPILLISTLADHTQNALIDPRASLMFDGTAGLDDPLTGSRVSVLGTLGRLEDDSPIRERAAARYLRRHPSAALYAGFGDFAFWRLEIEAAHLVAGFGKIHWIEGREVFGSGGLPLDDEEADVVEHMNDDHADAVDLYATRLLGLSGSGWQMTGCDREGADLRLGGQIARLPFDKPVQSAEQARVELVRLVKRARQ